MSMWTIFLFIVLLPILVGLGEFFLVMLFIFIAGTAAFILLALEAIVTGVLKCLRK